MIVNELNIAKNLYIYQTRWVPVHFCHYVLMPVHFRPYVLMPVHCRHYILMPVHFRHYVLMPVHLHHYVLMLVHSATTQFGTRLFLRHLQQPLFNLAPFNLASVLVILTSFIFMLFILLIFILLLFDVFVLAASFLPLANLTPVFIMVTEVGLYCIQKFIYESSVGSSKQHYSVNIQLKVIQKTVNRRLSSCETKLAVDLIYLYL